VQADLRLSGDLSPAREAKGPQRVRSAAAAARPQTAGAWSVSGLQQTLRRTDESVGERNCQPT